eukprot:1161186-Pelagomonas_calceolata.AAC.11
MIGNWPGDKQTTALLRGVFSLPTQQQTSSFIDAGSVFTAYAFFFTRRQKGEGVEHETSLRCSSSEARTILHKCVQTTEYTVIHEMLANRPGDRRGKEVDMRPYCNAVIPRIASLRSTTTQPTHPTLLGLS